MPDNSPYKSSKPTYDIFKSWDDNYKDGPQFDGEIPELQTQKKWRFLGRELISPLGIAAGPLPNSKWIDLYAKLGFGSLVHKTMRSKFHPCHPNPNVLIVDVKGKLDPNSDDALVGHSEFNGEIKNLSITNSFGNPSPEPKVWMEEVKKETGMVSSGQLLIVSVYGTNEAGMSIQELADDYAKAAVMAKDAGATVIEINLSCPNVMGDEDPNLYCSPVASSIITKTVKQAIGSTPLIIKVGYYDKYEKIVNVLSEIGGYFDAVSAINTVSKKIVDKNGNQALPGRDTSGVCGAAIKEFGIEMVEKFRKARKELGLDFEIIGTGGVMTPLDVLDYLKAGANHVHCATAAMWNPYLAYEFQQMQNEMKSLEEILPDVYTHDVGAR